MHLRVCNSGPSRECWLVMGGLGLRSAHRGRQTSFWSNWADVLHMVRLRHPATSETMLRRLASGNPGHHFGGELVARDRLQDMGPSGAGCSLRDSLILKVGSRHHGWQQETTKDNFLLPHLNAHSPRRESVVPHPQCVDVDGAAKLVARRQKQRGHAELAGDHGRARLVVLACQVKGRWSDICHFLCQVSKTNARQEPPFLQHRVRHTWLLW